jgi:hypothetical protein
LATFLFTCPSTGQQVQGWIADEVKDNDSYRAVPCLACHHIHKLNPKTGKIKGRSGVLQDFADFSELVH